MTIMSRIRHYLVALQPLRLQQNLAARVLSTQTQMSFEVHRKPSYLLAMQNRAVVWI